MANGYYSGPQVPQSEAQAFLRAFEELPEAERRTLIEALYRDYAGESGALTEQSRLAQELRGSRYRPGYSVGREFSHYVAPSGLSDAATAAQRGLGLYQGFQTIRDRQALANARAAGLRRLGGMFLQQPELPVWPGV